MWKDLEDRTSSSSSKSVISTLDPSVALHWGSKTNPAALVGYGSTFGGESGKGSPCKIILLDGLRSLFIYDCLILCKWQRSAFVW